MPRKIEVLPESVSQCIAAGEVVERPASVVKELMENAIDAGSSEITVELKAGGLRLIRVWDNGEGMDREDVALSLRRYATSKVKKTEDLYAIHTLGFRGEALPSIAQVSKMTLRTRTRDSVSGTKLISEGGEIKDISEVGCPIGTEVEVSDLFYNIPVKRKFLKSIRSELRYALNHFVRLSLSHPGISLKLVHDGRTLHEHPKTEAPLVRVEAIFGKEIYRHLQPVGFEEGDLQVSGFASLPTFSKGNAEGVYFYVNRRFIKDRMVYKAILDSYRHLLPNNQFPVAILFITLSPSTVDVNVHPTKAEVKFRDPERIYQAVSAALRALLENKESCFLSEERISAARKERFLQERTDPPLYVQDTLSFSAPSMPGGTEQDFMVREGPETQWSVEQKWRRLIHGQIQGTYILYERNGNLIFVDQHAAHERILFEKFKRAYESESSISERLLVPILIELSVEESCILESAGEALSRIGFEIESVGEKLFAIRSLPTFIDQKNPEKVVRGILDEFSSSEGKGREEESLHAILITLACHSAIKGNFELKREEMDRLVEDLADFHLASTCPHGRPIFFVLPLEELKRQFKRK